MTTGNDTTVEYVWRSTTGPMFAKEKRGRIRGVYFLSGSGADGLVVFREKDAGGVELCRFMTAGKNQAVPAPNIPGRGLSFRRNVHATLSNVSFCGMFYSEDRAPR